MNESYSKEAEQSVLGGLMLNNDAWDDVSEILSETDFYLREHQLIWRAFIALAKKSDPFDPVTLAEFLISHNFLERIGGGPYLAMLASNIPSSANIIAYAKIAKDRSVTRQLLKIGINIAESVNNPNGRTVLELIEVAEQSIYQLTRTGKQASFVKTAELLNRLTERLDFLAANKGAFTGLDTGFTKLNEYTNGLQNSDLIIVAGTPGTGKTSFSINIATYAIQNKKTVAIFSLEMPDVQLGNKIISMISGVNLHQIINGPADNDWPKITEAISILDNYGDFLQIDASPSLTPLELRSRARKLASHQELDLIIVDYLQLMNCPNNDNRVEEISEISRGLKSLSKELNVPVIALSQLNREASKRTSKRPIMQDLRGSGEIEQNADMIIMLYRDDDELGNDAEVNIVKHRNGPTGSFVLRFDAATTTFKNIENDDYN
jgi:replicative DNA helicase